MQFLGLSNDGHPLWDVDRINFIDFPDFQTDPVISLFFFVSFTRPRVRRGPSFGHLKPALGVGGIALEGNVCVSVFWSGISLGQLFWSKCQSTDPPVTFCHPSVHFNPHRSAIFFVCCTLPGKPECPVPSPPQSSGDVFAGLLL